jgi:hypothetical protein
MDHSNVALIQSAYVIWLAPWFGLIPALDFSKEGNGQGLSFDLTGKFANDRLRPWSRQQSSIGSFLSVFSQALVVPITWVGGMVCGFILSSCKSGNSLIALQSWWFLPFVVMVTACGVALAIIGRTWFRRGASLSCCTIGLISPKFFLFINQHLTDLIIYLAIIFLLTLILVPLAWYRLSRAELP